MNDKFSIYDFFLGEVNISTIKAAEEALNPLYNRFSTTYANKIVEARMEAFKNNELFDISKWDDQCGNELDNCFDLLIENATKQRDRENEIKDIIKKDLENELKLINSFDFHKSTLKNLKEILKSYKEAIKDENFYKKDHNNVITSSELNKYRLKLLNKKIDTIFSIIEDEAKLKIEYHNILKGQEAHAISVNYFKSGKVELAMYESFCKPVIDGFKYESTIGLSGLTCNKCLITLFSILINMRK